MDYTTNLKLPLIVPNQAGKEIMHNEALVILDNIVQNGIISKDLSIPPENTNTNDIYIVGANATGTWEGKDNQLAFFDNGWRFIKPREGFTFWINDKDKLYCYNGTNWQEITSSDSSTTSKINELQNLSFCGINTTADNENKLSIKSDYVLFDNNGTNSKIKANKAALTNTVSHLFQNNYSSRAEFGLIADDNFTLKVSSDGENWNNAFVVDKETGNIDFKGEITQNGNAISSISNLMNEINISNNDAEIIINNINQDGVQTFIFDNIQLNQTSDILIYFSTDNGNTYLENGVDTTIKYEKSNNYQSTTRTSNISYVRIGETGYNFANYQNNSLFGKIEIGNLINTNCSKNGNIAFSYNSDVGGLSVICNAIGSIGIYSNTTINAIKIVPSSGTFLNGKIKHYIF